MSSSTRSTIYIQPYDEPTSTGATYVPGTFLTAAFTVDPRLKGEDHWMAVETCRNITSNLEHRCFEDWLELSNEMLCPSLVGTWVRLYNQESEREANMVICKEDLEGETANVKTYPWAFNEAFSGRPLTFSEAELATLSRIQGIITFRTDRRPGTLVPHPTGAVLKPLDERGVPYDLDDEAVRLSAVAGKRFIHRLGYETYSGNTKRLVGKDLEKELRKIVSEDPMIGHWKTNYIPQSHCGTGTQSSTSGSDEEDGGTSVTLSRLSLG